MVVGATFKRVSTEGVLSKVFHPERESVADASALILESGDFETLKGVARTFVKLWDLEVSLRDGVAEGGSDRLSDELAARAELLC